MVVILVSVILSGVSLLIIKLRFCLFSLFVIFCFRMYNAHISNMATIVVHIWFAPKPSPTLIIKNKKPNSSGSFIAARNLTIDNAPTRPNDNASDDFTTMIINVVVVASMRNVCENFSLFDNVDPYFMYTLLMMNENNAASNMAITIS